MCKKSHGDYFEKDNNEKKVYFAVIEKKIPSENHLITSHTEISFTTVQ